MSDKKLIIKLAADVEGLKKGMKQAKNQVNRFKGELDSVASTLAGTFAAREVIAFGLEVSKLAGEAAGVESAFKRLGTDSEKLLNRMKEATHNTVAELDLMKRAVMASNFKISLEALPRLLEFATLRAQQTGQSVDYLVDSIVTGIGRKSALILDNLGISSAELNEQLKITPDYATAVAEIINREMPKMGAYVENAATSAQQLNAAFENLKVSIGELVNSAGIPALFTELTNVVNFINNDSIPSFKKLALILSIPLNGPGVLFEVSDAVAELNKNLSNTVALGPELPPGLFAFPAKIKETAKTVNDLKEEIKKLNEEIGASSSNKQISVLQKAIEEKESELFDLMNGKAKERPGAITPTADPKLETQNPSTSINTTSEALMNQTNELLKNKAATLESQNAWMEWQDQMAMASNMAAELGSSLGGVFADMANDSITAAQGMARAASAILASIERVVIGRMIQKAVDGAGPGPFAIAAAAAAFAAGRALFSKIGSSGGGGGAGGGLAASSSVSTVGEYRSGLSSSSQSSAPVLETQIRGQDLWVVLKNYESSKYSTHG